jgi:hypothetical protein
MYVVVPCGVTQGGYTNENMGFIAAEQSIGEPSLSTSWMLVISEVM